MTGFRKRRERRRGQTAGGNMLNEQLKWRVFPTVFKYSRRHMKSWLKPRLQESQVDTHLKMIHACTNLQILNYEVIFLRSSADYARRIRRWNPRRRTIWKIKFARSSQRTVTRAHTHPSNQGGPRVGRLHRVRIIWRAGFVHRGVIRRTQGCLQGTLD